MTLIRGPAFELNSIGELNLDKTPFRALSTTNNVNFSISQTLPIYQSPSGQESIISGAIVLVTTAIGVTTSPTMSLGTVTGGGSDIFGVQTLNINTTGETWIFWNLNSQNVLVGDTPGQAAEAVITPSDGTLFGNIYLLGSLV